MGAPPGAGGATRASGRGLRKTSLLRQAKFSQGTATVRGLGVRRIFYSARLLCCTANVATATAQSATLFNKKQAATVKRIADTAHTAIT